MLLQINSLHIRNTWNFLTMQEALEVQSWRSHVNLYRNEGSARMTSVRTQDLGIHRTRSTNKQNLLRLHVFLHKWSTLVWISIKSSLNNSSSLNSQLRLDWKRTDWISWCETMVSYSLHWSVSSCRVLEWCWRCFLDSLLSFCEIIGRYCIVFWLK